MNYLIQKEFYNKLKEKSLIKKIKSFKKVLNKLRNRLRKKRKYFSQLRGINLRFPKDFKIRSSKNSKIESYGVIHLLCNKRNIFCTLADYSGQIKASVSTGLLKVKGKKRKAFHYVPKTSQLLLNHIFKIKYRKYRVQIKGNGPKKKKRILINSFLKIKKFKFVRLNNLAPRSHNGCRPPKIRRK